MSPCDTPRKTSRIEMNIDLALTDDFGVPRYRTTALRNRRSVVDGATSTVHRDRNGDYSCFAWISASTRCILAMITASSSVPVASDAADSIAGADALCPAAVEPMILLLSSLL